jgi:hypothetical protein
MNEENPRQAAGGFLIDCACSSKMLPSSAGWLRKGEVLLGRAPGGGKPTCTQLASLLP